jgi:hypothetical protein
LAFTTSSSEPLISKVPQIGQAYCFRSPGDAVASASVLQSGHIAFILVHLPLRRHQTLKTKLQRDQFQQREER